MIASTSYICAMNLLSKKKAGHSSIPCLFLRWNRFFKMWKQSLMKLSRKDIFFTVFFLLSIKFLMVPVLAGGACCPCLLCFSKFSWLWGKKKKNKETLITVHKGKIRNFSFMTLKFFPSLCEEVSRYFLWKTYRSFTLFLCILCVMLQILLGPFLLMVNYISSIILHKLINEKRNFCIHYFGSFTVMIYTHIYTYINLRTYSFGMIEMKELKKIPSSNSEFILFSQFSDACFLYFTFSEVTFCLIIDVSRNLPVTV